jgi:hypothetical protein
MFLRNVGVYSATIQKTNICSYHEKTERDRIRRRAREREREAK